MPDLFGQGTGSLAGDVNHAVVGGDLVEEGEEAGWLGEDPLGEVGFELQESIVDAEAVVLDASLEQFGQFLLPGQSLTDLEKLSGVGIHCVIEGDLVVVPTLFPTEVFFTKVSDLAVNVEVQPLEVMQPGDQLEDLGAKGRSDLKRGGTWIFVELADLVGRIVGVLMDFYLNEFGRAGFENAAVSEYG